jgi:transposase InsO family protein
VRAGNLHAAEPQEVIAVIDCSLQNGLSVRRSCLIPMIQYRRIVRWQQRVRRGLGLQDRRLGPTEPLHKLLPEETSQIVAMAKDEQYADLSHRIVALTAADKGLFQASFSTVYRVLRKEGFMTARGAWLGHNGHSKPPVRNKLTGPNQRWCWDISYLMTHQKGQYLYLYLLLNEWSRKTIQWRISCAQTAGESRWLLEGGLTGPYRDPNVVQTIDLRTPLVLGFVTFKVPSSESPASDRGRQMSAKPIQRLPVDHGMPQFLSHLRTPNDNPFIESAFSTAKRAPEYPGRFLDDREAVTSFTRCFHCPLVRHRALPLGHRLRHPAASPQQPKAGHRGEATGQSLLPAPSAPKNKNLVLQKPKPFIIMTGKKFAPN